MGVYWCLPVRCTQTGPPWDTVPGIKIPVCRCTGRDVSSKGGEFARLSPFSVVSKPRIPVPGQPGLVSDSVEGIWQGLKIINGKPDFSLFRGRPYKRKGRVEGHLYGNKILRIVEARRAIYLLILRLRSGQGYEFFLKHHCSLILGNLAALARNRDIYLHCIGNTTNRVDDFTKPLSHAALVVEAVRRIIEKEE